MSILPENLSRSSTPDITPTEWKTTIGVVATILTTLFGLDISDNAKAGALSVVVAFWVIGQTLGNAIVRHGRATGVFAVEAGNQPPMDPIPPAGQDNDDTVVANAVSDVALDPAAGDVTEEIPVDQTEVIPPDEGDAMARPRRK